MKFYFFKCINFSSNSSDSNCRFKSINYSIFMLSNNNSLINTFSFPKSFKFQNTVKPVYNSLGYNEAYRLQPLHRFLNEMTG